MIELDTIKAQQTDLHEKLLDPTIIKDIHRYKKLSKEYKHLTTIITLHEKIAAIEEQQQEMERLISEESDKELVAFAREERTNLEKEQLQSRAQLEDLLIPRDPEDDKNVILELRAGTGGDEASLWVKDLYRMYSRYAESKRWKITPISYTEGAAGGYKEIISNITGDGGIYGHLRYESGVHRVQRIPATETQGRIHTSATSVVVLPEMDDVEVDIDMNDVKKETFCSSGPGGQSVNTTYSAVRLTHEPTGIVVSCQDGKSQLKNLEQALKVLRARLYKRALKERDEKIGKERRKMVGSGDRSAKIRTYNYPRTFVNDHRIEHGHLNLPSILEGGLDELIEGLKKEAYQNLSRERKE